MMLQLICSHCSDGCNTVQLKSGASCYYERGNTCSSKGVNIYTLTTAILLLLLLLALRSMKTEAARIACTCTVHRDSL
jgi:hypothetical protein